MTRVPQLDWTQQADGSYAATDADGTRWTITRHPAPPRLQGKTPDWRPKWWLHRPDDTESGPALVTGARWTALHRHPETLRYADALAAGWTTQGQVQGQTATGGHNWVMARGDETTTLSELLAD